MTTKYGMTWLGVCALSLGVSACTDDEVDRALKTNECENVGEVVYECAGDANTGFTSVQRFCQKQNGIKVMQEGNSKACPNGCDTATGLCKD